MPTESAYSGRRDDPSAPMPAARDVLLPPVSGKAVWGLILGVLSLFLGILASIPAFLLGARALREIKRDPARVGGRRVALAGILFAGAGLILTPILMICVVQVARDRIQRDADAANLRRIGEAMYAYNGDHKNRFPPAVSTDAKGQPLLSWRVALLPYLGEKELYEQFHINEPWDSPHNAPLVRRMPTVYAHPADSASAAQGLTYYRVFIGEPAPFTDPLGPQLSDSYSDSSFRNGTSQTILVAEAADPVLWTKPDELLYDPSKPIPKLGGLMRGFFHRGRGTMGLCYAKGCNVLIADGSVRFIRDDLPDNTLREAIGEPFWWDW